MNINKQIYSYVVIEEGGGGGGGGDVWREIVGRGRKDDYDILFKNLKILRGYFCLKNMVLSLYRRVKSTSC